MDEIHCVFGAVWGYEGTGECIKEMCIGDLGRRWVLFET
jgi:hypothetical protein